MKPTTGPDCDFVPAVLPIIEGPPSPWDFDHFLDRCRPSIVRLDQIKTNQRLLAPWKIGVTTSDVYPPLFAFWRGHIILVDGNHRAVHAIALGKHFLFGLGAVLADDGSLFGIDRPSPRRLNRPNARHT